MSSDVWLDQILGLVCSVFDAHTCALFKADEDRQRYPMAGYFSLSDHVDAGCAMTPGQGLVGWIIRDGQPLLINNFDQKRGYLGYYAPGVEAQIRAFMGTPLDHGLGALCLDSKRTYSFSSKDQKILHQFAQLITSLHGAQCRMDADGVRQAYYAALTQIGELRQQSKLRWNQYLDALLTIVAGASGFAHCFLAVRDETGKHFMLEGENTPLFKGPRKDLRFPMGSGTIGWVFREGVPLIADETETRSARAALFGKEIKTPPFHTVVCLPLRIYRRIRGVLVLADEGNFRVDDQLKVFLRLVSDNLALLLENLYLKNRLTRSEPTE